MRPPVTHLWDAEHPPWERQRGETTRAFDAFCTYRDMGPARSIRKLAKQPEGKSRAVLERWSSRWGWVERVQAWDCEVDRERRSAQLDEIRSMSETHAKVAVLLQQRLVDRLKNLDPERIPVAALPQWLWTAVRVERLARGVGRMVDHVAKSPEEVRVFFSDDWESGRSLE